MNILKKTFWPAIFTLGGAILGLLYYVFFGCTDGCAIKSNPYLLVAWGAVMGFLLSIIFKKEK